MNGEISVTSSAGEGTTFEVTLPARPAEDGHATGEEPGGEAEPGTTGATGGEPSTDLKGQEERAARRAPNEEIRSPSW
jgi:hypothetical protein